MCEVRPVAEDERYARDLAARWFDALDRRQIHVGRRRWAVRVLGIHLDGGQAWIQMAAGPAQKMSLVLHVSGWTTIDQALAAMRSRPLEHAAHPRVISVVPTV